MRNKNKVAIQMGTSFDQKRDSSKMKTERRKILGCMQGTTKALGE